MMYQWFLVAVIVASTVAGDLLQSYEMKRHAHADVGRTVTVLFRRPLLGLSVLSMAVSFFAFMTLLSVAELSFAVPVTAASLVVETILAKYLLRERVDSRRWTGALLVAAGIVLIAL
jgi:drug/metabolite transporter (DMT)-like permease